MPLVAVILDRRTRSPEGAQVPLLALPLGAGSFLDYLAGRLAALPDRMDRELLVMPTFRCGQGYEQRIQCSTAVAVEVIQPEGLATVLDECESADYLLLVDAGRWPVGGFDFAAIMRGNGNYRAATHMIAVGADGERTREQVECDAHGRVKRVERLYNGVTWPEVATTDIFLSLAPARTIGDTHFTSLADLRSALSAKGVLSRDLPLATDVVDLTRADGVLALNERMLAREIHRAPRPGFVAKGAQLLVGPESRIHPSAHLIGPVIVQERVTVEAGVTIVGPTIVGSGSWIRGGATIAQSVLAPNSVVASKSTIRHRVVSGDCSTSSAGVEPPPEASYSHSSLRALDEHPCAQSMEAGAVRPMRRGRQAHLAAKRLIDGVLSLAALLVLSPLLIVVAILIKLESPGPVLFVHRREQKGGKEFPCLKFRTMVADAHRQQRVLYKQNALDGPQFKLRHDPRITRVGRWVRGTNIDELPQLINVLLGHMSLVGPRPSPFRENQICVPWRRARLSVRPGITGLWQICRSEDRSAGDFHQWIFYDIAYVRHLSIWLDMKIMLATVLTQGGRWSVPLSWMVRGEAGRLGSRRQPAVA